MAKENPILTDYIKKLKRKMFWMSGKKKKLLIDETAAHIDDVAHDVGGKKEEAYREAILYSIG